MMSGSSNDNQASGIRDGQSGRNPETDRFQFIDALLVDTLLYEASALAQQAYRLVEASGPVAASSRSDILETLLKNRDAFLTTTRLTHAVAWLLAAKEVISVRKPVGYLANFDLAAVRTLADDPYLSKAASGESLAWDPLLKKSHEIFCRVVELNDLVKANRTGA